MAGLTLRDQLNAALQKAVLRSASPQPGLVPDTDSDAQDFVAPDVNAAPHQPLGPVYLSNMPGAVGMAGEPGGGMNGAVPAGYGGTGLVPSPLPMAPEQDDPSALTNIYGGFGAAADTGAQDDESTRQRMRQAELLDALHALPDEPEDSDQPQQDEEDGADSLLVAAAPGAPHVVPRSSPGPISNPPPPAANPVAQGSPVPASKPRLTLQSDLSDRGAPFPKTQHKYDDIILRELKGREDLIDPVILKAMINKESSFNPLAGNGSHIGLMQVDSRKSGWTPAQLKVPQTAIHAGLKFYREAKNSIDGYLKKQGIYDQYTPEERTQLALTAYNAGPTTVQNAMGEARKRGTEAPKQSDLVADGEQSPMWKILPKEWKTKDGKKDLRKLKEISDYAPTIMKNAGY